ncbi:MAG TPA: hypothetical protein VGJ20_41195 [Xanthobacteraceae bacterium]
MTKKSILALIAALTTASIVASPALAQSFNPRDGTGNMMPFAYGQNGSRQMTPAPENNQIAVGSSGLNAYATVRHTHVKRDHGQH